MNPDIEIRLFEKLDAYAIKLRPQDEAVRDDPFFEAWVEKNEGASFTAIRKSDGKILGCGGLRVINPGIGEAWCLYCDAISDYKREAYEYAFSVLPELAKKLNLSCLQARVRNDNAIAMRYAENLGFRYERMTDDNMCLYSLNFKAVDPQLSLRDKVNVLESKILESPNPLMGDSFPLKHSFAKGLYIREISVPAGIVLVSKIHRFTYAFFLLKGEFETLEEGGIKRVSAPSYFVMTAGEKHTALILRDVVAVTVHAAEETDLGKIEDELIIKTFNVKEYRELTKKVIAGEKDGFWSDWTEEQQKLYISGDWKAFSRSRGYSEEEIADVQKWLDMKDLGESQGFPLCQCK
jgi:RimJ/RimL family protein N-acetyltransferase/quercetin dioxygenase-like cupin family protein